MENEPLEQNYLDRKRRAIVGAFVGFTIGDLAGEFMQVINNDFIHEPHNFPPVIAGAIGAAAVGIALYRTRERNDE